MKPEWSWLARALVTFHLALVTGLASGQTWLPTGTLSGTNTWTGSNTFSGTVTIDTLRINDTADNNYLSLILNENLSADRTLNIIVSNASRTLTISGDSSINQALLTSSAPTFAGLTSTAATNISGVTTITKTHENAFQVLNGSAVPRFNIDTDLPGVQLFSQTESFTAGTHHELATYGDITIYPTTIPTGSGKQTSRLILNGDNSGSAPDGNYLLGVRDYQYSNTHNGAPVTFITTNGQIWTGRELHASGNYDTTKTGDEFAYYKPFQTSSGGVTSCMLGVAGDELGAAFQLTCPDPADGGGQNTYLMLGGYSSWNASTPASSTFAATFAMEATGKLWWGLETTPANFATAGVSKAPSTFLDTNLYRSAANTLKTDDSFVVAGNLSATGDVAVNTNKFNVTASSGNTTAAGTLGVTGATTLSSTLAVANTATITQPADSVFSFLTLTPNKYGQHDQAGEPNVPRFRFTVSDPATQSGHNSNRVFLWGINNDGNGGKEDPNEIKSVWGMELGYNATGTERWQENYSEFRKAGDASHLWRGLYIYYKTPTFGATGDPNVDVGIQATQFNLNTATNDGSGTSRMIMSGAGVFNFYTDSFSLNNTSSQQGFKYSYAGGAHFLFAAQTNSYICADNNNVGAFRQKNAAGSAYPTLIYLDSADKVQVGDSARAVGVSGALTVTGATTLSGSPVTLKGNGGGAGIVGQSTLVGGTKVVNTTAVTASSIILITATAAPAGRLYVTTIVAGTSFTITSTNAGDAMAVNWMIVEPS